MEGKEVHVDYRKANSANISVPRKWSEEPFAHLPPGGWLAVSLSQTFLFCSTGQNVFLL